LPEGGPAACTRENAHLTRSTRPRRPQEQPGAPAKREDGIRASPVDPSTEQGEVICPARRTRLPSVVILCVRGWAPLAEANLKGVAPSGARLRRGLPGGSRRHSSAATTSINCRITDAFPANHRRRHFALGCQTQQSTLRPAPIHDRLSRLWHLCHVLQSAVAVAYCGGPAGRGTRVVTPLLGAPRCATASALFRAAAGGRRLARP